MTCNVFKSPPMTLAEAKEAMGMSLEFPEAERRRGLEETGMSQRQIADVLRSQRGAWNDQHSSIIIGPDDGTSFLCGDLVVPVCKCGVAADYLCDYPIGKGKTCDLNLCPGCLRHIGDDLDLCEIHFAEFVKKSGANVINPWPPRRT